MKIKTYTSGIFAIFVFFGIIDGARAANLLVDPGFEKEPQYSAWKYWDDTGRAKWAKRDGFSGAYFRDWNDFGDEPEHSGGFYQDIEVRPAEEYAFSIWMRKEREFEADKINITVIYYNTLYNQLDVRTRELHNVVTQEWKRYGISTRAPAGSVIARVMVTFSGGKGERGQDKSFLMDDAVFNQTR